MKKSYFLKDVKCKILIGIKYKDYFGHNKIISDMNKTDILYLN